MAVRLQWARPAAFPPALSCSRFDTRKTLRITTSRPGAASARCHPGCDDRLFPPDADHEALRDLVRAREDARQDQHRARHSLSKFLMRHGRRPPEDVKKSWTLKYMT